MKKRRSDKELTIALCVSLILHAGLMVLLIHEKIELLLRQLTPPPVLADARPLPKLEDQKEEEPEASEPPPILLQPAPKIISEFVPPKPPAPPEPPIPPKKKSDINDENIDWGEKNGKGFAITSAPGKVDMSARKGIEDQSFASRDPQGPEMFPDEPSQSTARPGENGDGRKAVRDPLAGKGTDGSPEQLMGHPEAKVVPPAPQPEHERRAMAESAAARVEKSGKSLSQMPVPEKRSPAEANVSTGERDGLANESPTAESEQILPIKRADVIGIRSNQQAYPDVVAALTRPPGVKLSPETREPIESPVLPNVVAADVPAAPVIQPATAALEAKPRALEEMARLLGETDPLTGPAIVEAMTHAPGDVTLDGGEAPLPELAQADQAGAPEILDAITPLLHEDPRLEEMAQMLQQGTPAPTTPSESGKPTSVASATGGVPGPPISAADPAPDTGLESDPFAKIPGVDFHDGKVEARSGREVKPIRPRLTEAGRRDLLAMQFPTVVFKVRIDKTGKVKDVSVIQGSGSEAIDMPVYRSLWEWWFEPPKDKQGNPLEDVQLVSIHWG